MLFQKRVVGTKFDVYGFFLLILALHLIIKLMRVLISYVVAIVVFTFLSVSTAKLHLLVGQAQLTLSDLLRSPRFVADFVAWSFCMVFCRSLFVFGHWIVCSSIDGFWLPLGYLQTVFNERIYICLGCCINLSYGVKQDDNNILKILRFIYISYLVIFVKNKC